VFRKSAVLLGAATFALLAPSAPAPAQITLKSVSPHPTQALLIEHDGNNHQHGRNQHGEHDDDTDDSDEDREERSSARTQRHHYDPSPNHRGFRPYNRPQDDGYYRAPNSLPSPSDEPVARNR